MGAEEEVCDDPAMTPMTCFLLPPLTFPPVVLSSVFPLLDFPKSCEKLEAMLSFSCLVDDADGCWAAAEEDEDEVPENPANPENPAPGVVTVPSSTAHCCCVEGGVTPAIFMYSLRTPRSWGVSWGSALGVPIWGMPLPMMGDEWGTYGEFAGGRDAD